MFLGGGPGKPISIGETVQETLRETPAPRHVRGGFAYATERGVSMLCKDSTGSDWRDESQVEWIIGVDQGITEPEALRELQHQNNSTVRVFVPGGTLSRRALHRRPRFHAKVLSIESIEEEEQHLVTTSANMTGSALGDRPTNFEIGSIHGSGGDLSDEDKNLFDQWWESAWSRACPVTPEFLDEYSDIRDSVLRDNPIIEQFESSDVVNQPSEAIYLWIETRKMTGGSGNQVEFSRDLSPFFDGHDGSVQIRFPNGEFEDRPITPRTTDPPYGVDIAPLYLPTGVNYQHSAIRFERLNPGATGRPQYELVVREQDDPEVQAWKESAEQEGIVGETIKGRKYGYY